MKDFKKDLSEYNNVYEFINYTLGSWTDKHKEELERVKAEAFEAGFKAGQNILKEHMETWATDLHDNVMNYIYRESDDRNKALEKYTGIPNTKNIIN